MLIHVAWYGPKGGHAFIASTDDSMQSVFRQAAWLTDLPGTASGGLEWQAYFRTFIYENYFVLVHTRPNREVSRTGMVDSVAAFIPLNDLERIPNIKAVAEALSLLHDNEDRKPLEVDEQGSVVTSAELSPLLLRIANALVEGTKRPVIHIGQNGFDDAMLELLQRVPAPLRKEILFSIGILPEYLGNSIAVSVPRSLAVKFSSDLLLPDFQSHEPLSVGASVLLTLSDGEALRAFAEAVGFKFDSFKSLNLLEDSFQLWNKGTSVSDTIALVRFMAAKSGETPAASEMRAEALAKLLGQAAHWTVADVLSMRNLELERFAGGVKLQDELRSWTETVLCSESNASREEVKLLEQAIQSLANPWWVSGVQDGVVAALTSRSTSASALAWTTIQRLPNALEQILDLVGKAKDGLQTLALNTPNKLGTAIAEAISQSAAKRGEWTLCGTTLAACYPPNDALAELVMLKPPKASRLSAIEAALNRASDKQLIDVAVHQDLPEVTTMAAKVLVADGRLLGGFDWFSPVWFEALQQATSISPELIAELPDRTKGMEVLVARGESSERIWRAIAKTELADLYRLSNRAQAWTLVPSTVQMQIVAATCKTWLSALEAGKADTNALEEPLRESVRAQLSEPAYMPTLASRAPAAFVRCLGGLYPRTEHECQQLINAFARDMHKRLGPVAATSLGGLIRDHRWYYAASRIADLAKQRDDFLIVCRECLSLLNFLDRLLLGRRLGEHVELPADEAWTMLEDVLAKLYPQGPADQEIWSRSRGRYEELSFEGNGVAQWHRCLKQVRAGNGPKASDLLRTALKDFSGNDTLQILQSSRVFN